MNIHPIKTITLKGVSLFLYLNVIGLSVVLLALYFSSLFIFNQEKHIVDVFQQWQLHCVIWASLFSIAAGYIIHYFYEEEMFYLQRPFVSYFQQFLEKREYLTIYIILNVVSLGLSALVSIPMLLFFMVYQFLIWLYSHKLKSTLIIGNLSKTLLTLLPFLALMYYFQNYSYKVISFGVLLFLLIFIKEVLKDTITSQTDSLFKHETVPNTFGKGISKNLILVLIAGALLVNIFILYYYNLGILEYYLYASIIAYFFIAAFLFSPFEWKYKVSLQILKLWIFAGIISIPFINWNLHEVLNSF